jgi:SAM-dependent methyltransferase
MEPNPLVSRWLDESGPAAGEAVVVACGLGDDAEALAGAGWRVTAFDISPTAIEWCRERFPGTDVTYVVADLFDLPPEWTGAFSLVVEVLTIQSLAPHSRSDVIRSIATLLAPGGTLLVATHGTAAAAPGTGPPWPLATAELAEFTSQGLREVRFEATATPWEGVELYHAEFERPID